MLYGSNLSMTDCPLVFLILNSLSKSIKSSFFFFNFFSFLDSLFGLFSLVSIGLNSIVFPDLVVIRIPGVSSSLSLSSDVLSSYSTILILIVSPHFSLVCPFLLHFSHVLFLKQSLLMCLSLLHIPHLIISPSGMQSFAICPACPQV